MGKFGWDLPPGCTMRDIEDHFGEPDMSPEAEDVFELLDAAGVEQSIIDKVCETIDQLAFKECPICIEMQNEAERKADEHYRQMMDETHGYGYGGPR